MGWEGWKGAVLAISLVCRHPSGDVRRLRGRTCLVALGGMSYCLVPETGRVEGTGLPLPGGQGRYCEQKVVFVNSERPELERK